MKTRILGAIGVISALAALTVAPTIAHAGPPAKSKPAPTAEDAAKLEAQKLLTLGNQAVGDGDYLTALQKFQEAHEKFPSPKILLNIGTTLRQLGRNVEAREIYEAYLKDPGTDPARKAEIERVLVELDAVVGKLRIEVNKPNAVVRIDGKEIKDFQNGGTIRVEPGEHTIVADLEGFPPAIQTVVVGARDERLVGLSLKLMTKDTVVIVQQVYGPQRKVGFVVGGVGVAGLLVGGALGIVAKVKNSAAVSHCLGGGTVCDADGASLGSAAKASATGSTIAFVAGGAAVATGLVLVLTAPRAKPPEVKQGAAPSLMVGLAGPFVTAGGAW